MGKSHAKTPRRKGAKALVAGGDLPLGRIIQGDALEVLRTLPDESVHCVVTSPPHWGLRDYGEAGQGGLEETPEAHIAWLVGVMREVKRVLRKDGTCWFNYGDCYAGGGRGQESAGSKQKTNAGSVVLERSAVPTGLKPKDLLMMPARVALALQADGWWIRSDIIWAKPNPMPESCTDRPTNSYEHLFLMSKAKTYFYDMEAVREQSITGDMRRPYAPGQVDSRGNGHDRGGGELRKPDKQRGHRRPHAGFNERWDAMSKEEQQSGGRNLRNVWTIATQPYAGAHYATFPEKLVEPCIKAGTSEKGCCAECGAGWERIVEVSGGTIGKSWHDHVADGEAGQRAENAAKGGHDYQRATTGWRPTCACPAAEPVPAIVLDPFAGSGTTGVVAYRLGREFIGIDLAGGDKDLGGHTAHDRLEAARRGLDIGEVAGVVNGKRWEQEALL